MKKIDIESGMKSAEKSINWGIPENKEIDVLPLKLSDDQLKNMVLSIWREFMLHDEILSAISFLKNAPYRVKHSKEITEALDRTEKTIKWITNKSESQRVNSPLDPNGQPLGHEVTNALPSMLTGQVAGRFNWITNRLRKNDSIIDFGCIDGTMTNRWGLLGHPVVGVDMSTSSCKLAEEKAAEFSTGAMYFNCYFKNAPDLIMNNYFDVATCSDVYEHLMDPVEDLLIPARKLVNGKGRMLLVTPHGAWHRGEIVKWSPPWTWIEECGTWLDARPRAHLVAPTIWSVVENFRKAGWWVKNTEVVNQQTPDVEGQGNVCIEAIKSAPTNFPGKKILMVSPEPSEKSISLANELSSLGNRVIHYSNWNEENVVEFVDRIKMDRFFNQHTDVVICENELQMEFRNENWVLAARYDIQGVDQSCAWSISR